MREGGGLILLCQLGPLVQPLAGGDVPHTGLEDTENTLFYVFIVSFGRQDFYGFGPLTSMISSKASVTVSREDRANVSLS